MLRYTLRQVEYAISALDTGSIAGASERLGVAQPTLSAAIAKLEDQLGMQLFIRHHAQGVSATAQSQAFFAEARNLINLARDIERTSRSTGVDVEGTLALGSFTTIASAFAPKLIASFTAAHRKASIRLDEGAQDDLIDGLRTGRFEACLLYAIDLPDDIAATPLASIAPHVLLPASHPCAKRKKVALQSLAKEPFILLDVAPSRTYFQRVLKQAGVTPSIAFSSPSLEVVRGLVGQGLGYSVLITRPFGDHTYSGERLAAVPISEVVEKGIVALATLRQMRKTKLVSAFTEHCIRHFKRA